MMKPVDAVKGLSMNKTDAREWGSKDHVRARHSSAGGGKRKLTYKVARYPCLLQGYFPVPLEALKA